MTWMAFGGMLLIVGAGLGATLLRSRTPAAADAVNSTLES
jgi:hypothetical protein